MSLMTTAGSVASSRRPFRPATDREFAQFRALIQEEAGIHLPLSKKALLVRRLGGRLRDLGLRTFGDYYQRVTQEDDRAERIRMLDCICTNETHFFREPRQFEFLTETVFPAWRQAADRGQRDRRVRVWSVPCSTGEEPFSLAMSLLHHFPPESGWHIDVLASDLSTSALSRARRAEWPIQRAQEVPEHFLKRYMLKGARTQEGKMKAGPELRGAVRFQHVNLNDRRYAVAGLFDLILCRNVLIYFDAEVKAQVIKRLISHLAEPGYLLLGHAESLNGLNDSMETVVPTVYARPRSAVKQRKVSARGELHA